MAASRRVPGAARERPTRPATTWLRAAALGSAGRGYSRGGGAERRDRAPRACATRRRRPRRRREDHSRAAQRASVHRGLLEREQGPFGNPFQVEGKQVEDPGLPPPPPRWDRLSSGPRRTVAAVARTGRSRASRAARRPWRRRRRAWTDGPRRGRRNGDTVAASWPKRRRRGPATVGGTPTASRGRSQPGRGDCRRRRRVSASPWLPLPPGAGFPSRSRRPTPHLSRPAAAGKSRAHVLRAQPVVGGRDEPKRPQPLSALPNVPT